MPDSRCVNLSKWGPWTFLAVCSQCSPHNLKFIVLYNLTILSTPTFLNNLYIYSIILYPHYTLYSPYSPLSLSSISSIFTILYFVLPHPPLAAPPPLMSSAPNHLSEWAAWEWGSEANAMPKMAWCFRSFCCATFPFQRAACHRLHLRFAICSTRVRFLDLSHQQFGSQEAHLPTHLLYVSKKKWPESWNSLNLLKPLNSPCKP